MSDDIFAPPEQQFQPQPLPTPEQPKRGRRKAGPKRHQPTPMVEAKPRKKYTRKTSAPTATVNGDPFKPLMELIEAYKSAPAEVKAVFKKIFG